MYVVSTDHFRYKALTFVPSLKKLCYCQRTVLDSNQYDHTHVAHHNDIKETCFGLHNGARSLGDF